jgi:hypothetical protein
VGNAHQYFDMIRSRFVEILSAIQAIRSSLLATANEDLLPIADLRTINNTPIGQNNLANIISTTTNTVIVNINSSETSTKQSGIIKAISSPISVSKNTTGEINTSQVGILEVNPGEIGINEKCLSQIGIPQISISQNGMIQTSPVQTGTKQIGISQIGSSQVDINQISSPQADPGQISSFKSIDKSSSIPSFIVWNQFNPIENAFSSTISSQQFISSNLPNHLNTSELTNVESTAVTIWNNLVNPATISIDDNANGISWYIDQTPGDNSE